MKKSIKLIINAFRHLRKILIHKYWVGLYCFKCGLYWRGLVHDLSKFSPVEFFESIKYYQGDSSPINAAKKDKGYSLGWLHHKGINKHHLEYWFDRNRDGLCFIKIPYNYMLEMVCDRIAACKVYQKDKYHDGSALEYLNRSNDLKYMHPDSGKLLVTILTMLKEKGESYTFSYLKHHKINY